MNIRPGAAVGILMYVTMLLKREISNMAPHRAASLEWIIWGIFESFPDDHAALPDFTARPQYEGWDGV